MAKFSSSSLLDIKNVANSITGGLKGPTAGKNDVSPTIEQVLTEVGYKADVDIAKTWYQAKPYGFRFTDTKSVQYVMFLPINPSNLTITTHYATNIITTLYGTIEEHSEQRYFDIVIEGTTGMVPQFIDPFVSSDPKASPFRSPGRGTFEVRQTLPIDGFLQKAIGSVARIANSAADTIDTIRGKMRPNTTGVYPAKTGWQAFHNLYRFFLFYKSDAIKDRADRKTHPLIFFNYKDNNQYNVSVQRFILRRSADNPMLYNYSIVLRGYNLSTIGKLDILVSDADRLKSLGLNGLDNSSFFGKMKAVSGNLKSAVGAADGLIRNIKSLG